MICISTNSHYPERCIDNELLLVHIKCVDPRVWTNVSDEVRRKWAHDPNFLGYNGPRPRPFHSLQHTDNDFLAPLTFCGRAQRWANGPYPQSRGCRGGHPNQRLLSAECRAALAEEAILWQLFRYDGPLEQIPDAVRRLV